LPSSNGNDDTEDIEYPVVGRLSGDSDDALWSFCIGIDEKGDAYEVLIVGVGRDWYTLLLGLSSDDRLPEWPEELPLLTDEKAQLFCS
jgi:hypothetical protein